MSDTSRTTPSVSWRRRALRRSALSVSAAVVISGLVPAVANAAGAHVANPVAFALRASGHTLASALGMNETDTTSACTETDATESAAPTESATPTESVTPTESAAPSESAAPTESSTPSESAAPVESVSPPGDVVTGSESPSAEPSESATSTASDTPDEPAATEAPTCAEPSESESPEASESGDHGAIVATVAHCAPRGKDPLLAVEGAPAHHGEYVRAAAHGDSLTTPWGTFDLSTQAGADQLCAAVEAARAALPSPSASPATHGKHGRHDHVKPAKAGHGKGHDTSSAESDGTTEGTEATDAPEVEAG